MIIVAGEVRFAPGEIERLMPPMRAAIEGARGEEGCINYCYGRDALDPDLLVISERWRDEASLEAHLRQPHLLQFIGAVRQAKVEAMSVRMYPAGEARTLLGD
ncbi:MAG TPA: putative quinol monooxygenase [Allosphingosinicella sp.]|jgi:quinol monooxygenase YgiN